MSPRLATRLQTLAGAAALISIVTLLSRVLGFGRWMAQASWVGTAGIAEPYAVANQLPNILFEVVAGGALAGAVVPLLAGALSKGDDVALRRASSALLGWTLAALVPLALLLVVFAPQTIALLSDMRTPELEEKAIFFLRVFAVQIPLYGVGVVFGGILQAHKRFTWPALAPLFSSLVVIATYFIFGTLAQGNQANVEQLSAQSVEVLAWGTTAGVLAMAATMALPVRALRLGLRPSLTFPEGMGRRARNLAFAGIGALLAQQAAMLVVMKVSGRFGTGETFNLFQYSQAVYVLPYAVLVVPLATSMFPRIAAHASNNEHEAFAAMSSKVTRIVLVVSFLGAALLIAASQPLQDFFSSFTAGSVDGMAAAIAWAAPGLVGFSLILLCSRVLYSRDLGRQAVIATATGWLVAAAGSALPFLPGVTIAPNQVLTLVSASQSVGMTVAGILLLVAVRRSCGGQAVRGVARTAAVSLVAAALASLAGLSVVRLMPSAAGELWASIGQGLVAAAVALVVALVVIVILDRKTIKQLRSVRAGK